MADFVSPEENWTPFEYVDAVLEQETTIKFLANRYNFKNHYTPGCYALSYTDQDFGTVIKCIAENHWVDSVGNKVAGVSTSRPNLATLRGGDKYYETDNSRFVYWSRFAWGLTNGAVPLYGTKAKILAINPGSEWSDGGIYCTTDH